MIGLRFYGLFYKICCLFFAHLSSVSFADSSLQNPSAVYATWKDNPADSIVLCWHTEIGVADSTLLYREELEEEWKTIKGWVKEAPEIGIWIHQVELFGLSANTKYRFKVGTKEYRFRTVPLGSEDSIRLGIGGDAYYDKQGFIQMGKMMAERDPHAVVIGGDIAYVKRAQFLASKGLQRWKTFFELWSSIMVTKEGFLIPIVVTPGNHDVSKGDSLFFDLFALSEKGPSYRELKVGSFTSLLLLDSGHISPVTGAQTAWLDKQLQKQESKFVIPIYHIAAYPAYYPFDLGTSKKIQAEWVPLFEKGGVSIVFENHNHCYKRTVPLQGGKEVPHGIVFLGDGCWGTPPRNPDTKRSYLAKALKVQHLFLLTLRETGGVVEPLDRSGNLIDEVVKF